MKSIYEFLFSEHLLNEHLLKSKTATSTQDTEYVDLGLPSRLLWATCNIGTDEPTDYGDYFMWGSTEPNTNDDCDWKNCPFNDGGDDYDKFYFYSVKNKVCPNGILAPEYDAATVILGPDWRLPTDDDFKELMDNTTNTWVTNYQNSNINGRVFTSKTDGSKTLFIPASGYRTGSGFCYSDSGVYLWSSLLYTSVPYYARNLYSHKFHCFMSDEYRYYGFCLRGVKEN